ncbi:oocyte zinc finger protein XlCOF8.4-like isoform X2 [Engystomops pustulosus]|uniref:oocyte zinc finger protein XlCOF8.4-like isoform X2 n=1 Tax=Engystomops pustulosus TaxID=76066 RepID=UPI003AFA5BA6
MTMALFLSNLQEMDKERNKMAEKILNLSLEIIYLVTGEDYTVIKKMPGESVERTYIPITMPHPVLHDGSSKQKILDVTNKILEMLSGEVPIRCQDVSIHFSMEEWDYIEEHKDQYKYLLMEDHPPLTSLVTGCFITDEPPMRSPQERCPSPRYSQECQEEHRDELWSQGEDLADIKHEREKMDVEDEQQRKEEEIPADLYTGDCTRVLKEEDHSITLDRKEERIGLDSAPGTLVQNVSSGLQQNKLPRSYDKAFPDTSRILKDTGLRYYVHKRPKKPFSCVYCGKCFVKNSDLMRHHRVHTGEKPYPCSQCGKNFTQKSSLVQHQRIHTGEKSFSCSECGKGFVMKPYLIKHQRVHTEGRTFTCPDCGKNFTMKSDLMNHQINHTREKLFSCFGLWVMSFLIPH